MKIVRFKPDIVRLPIAAPFHPGVDYLLFDEVVMEMEEQCVTTGFDLFDTVTDYTSRNWLWMPEAQAPRTLLVYIDGHAGDVLWSTAVIHELKARCPEMLITVITSYDELFEHNPDVYGARFEPMPVSALAAYDAHLILERPVSRWRSSTQPNCYQILFAYAGLPFDPLRARPVLNLTRSDEETAFASFTNPDADGLTQTTQYHLVLGLHSSCHTRNLAPHQWREIAERVAYEFRSLDGYTIYGVSNDYAVSRPIHRALADLPGYVQLNNRMGLRQLAALCRTSSCVISVDSLLVHLAAAVDAPCVSIMTTVGPQQRTHSYPLNESVWPAEACSFGACYSKRSQFEHRKASMLEILPCYTPTRQYCDIAQAVRAEDVFAAFQRVAARKDKFDSYVHTPLPV